MSLVVAALVVGASALAASLAARAVSSRKPSAEGTPARTQPALARERFEIELGDVVEIAGRELWLEQGWLLCEGEDAVATLFDAREATLVVFPPPTSRVHVLDAIELELPDEPPSTLESRGAHFERARRIPVVVEPLGKTPPLPFDQALFAEYRGLGNDVIFVLGRGAGARVWQGRVAVESEIERWGGGASTL